MKWEGFYGKGFVVQAIALLKAWMDVEYFKEGRNNIGDSSRRGLKNNTNNNECPQQSLSPLYL